VLLLASGPSAADTACDAVPALSSGLKGLRTLRASYVDRKTMTLMDEPLVGEGRIAYRHPDRLRMESLKPGRQVITVLGDRVRVSMPDLGREQELDLGRSSGAQALVRGILGVLSGRLEGLAQDYACTAVPEGDGWRLRLVPRREPASRFVREMVVRVGKDRLPFEIRTEEVGGDASVMTLGDVQVDRPFTEAETKAWFDGR
jgi:outer membrane lipoprotein-sorting protein